MSKKSAFEKFAPAILKTYRRDKETFWSAVLAPFLSTDVPVISWLKHLRIDVELLTAFNDLDSEARQLLKEFSARFGLDVSTWKSNRIQYFKDAFPVFAFLAVWMDESGLNELVDRFGDVHAA